MLPQSGCLETLCSSGDDILQQVAEGCIHHPACLQEKSRKFVVQKKGQVVLMFTFFSSSCRYATGKNSVMRSEAINFDRGSVGVHGPRPGGITARRGHRAPLPVHDVVLEASAVTMSFVAVITLIAGGIAHVVQLRDDSAAAVAFAPRMASHHVQLQHHHQHRHQNAVQTRHLSGRVTIRE
ncbi:hypothetical protein E2C01_028830 [Portunus trituberculatus]|uniref:Uncharacterized protein n=1 Tax=Portunus trituberculatus TaxID=210409 RepID=A0A5B7EQ57_PORTR|nr:hypothetical protein [Portunus trituberculatus]